MSEDVKPFDFTNYWGYDFETYPNFFSAVFTNMATGNRFIFEISDWVDNAQEMWNFIWWCWQNEQIFVGFNNVHFDYPILHHFIMLCSNGMRPTALDLYAKAQAIIDAKQGDWTHTVWESDMYIQQVDVFKIMHFDNQARRTSLKKLEIAMRARYVEGLPILPGTPLREDQRAGMLWYNCWDVTQTIMFASLIWDRVVFRMELDERYGGRSRVNYNDTKIGKNHFLDILQQKGIKTKEFGKVIQTPRLEGIKVNEVLIPMQFDNPELQELYQFLNQQVIPPQNTKGFFSGLHARAREFKLDFGTGGIHGSIKKRTVRSDNYSVIIDADVTSYYPSIAIQWGFFPLHLGQQFCQIYSDMLDERRSYPKKSNPSEMLKLALNGTYGESNNKHSAFYDPQFTMAITINGQLLLAKLMEMLLTNPEVEPIQANTDGLTVRLPRDHLDWYYATCDNWMAWSRMGLEYVEYDSMHIRDVNNYIAVWYDKEGKKKMKHKGDYVTAPEWHKDHSSLVVQKAVSALVEDGLDLTHYIYHEATDPFDFMRSIRVGKTAKLYHGDNLAPKDCRYYISLAGQPMTKELPPLAGMDEPRISAVDKGWKLDLCNDAFDFDWERLNRRWYLDEAEKLTKGLGLPL